MRSGRMRNRVSIQEINTVNDDFSDDAQTWRTRSTVWANLEPLQSREQIDARQTYGNVSHRVTIRADVSVTPKMRLSLGGRHVTLRTGEQVTLRDGTLVTLRDTEANLRIFNIRGVTTVDEVRHWIVLICEEEL